METVGAVLVVQPQDVYVEVTTSVVVTKIGGAGTVPVTELVTVHVDVVVVVDLRVTVLVLQALLGEAFLGLRLSSCAPPYRSAALGSVS